MILRIARSLRITRGSIRSQAWSDLDRRFYDIGTDISIDDSVREKSDHVGYGTSNRLLERRR